MYDLMCGEVWENVTKNLAQKIAGKSRGDHLNGRDWQQFARECGLNPRQVLDRVGTLAKSALAEAEAAASEVAAMPAGTHEVLDQTREAVERGLVYSWHNCKNWETIRSKQSIKKKLQSPKKNART